jgi:hypothetical protein
MTRNTSLIAATLICALAAGSSGALARDFGYGGQYSAHLDPYDGRALGPPLTAFGPVYDDGDPRSFYAPKYNYIDRQFAVTLPDGYYRHPRHRRVRPY